MSLLQNHLHFDGLWETAGSHKPASVNGFSSFSLSLFITAFWEIDEVKYSAEEIILK